MIKILFGLYIVFSCTNLYASALDDLVSQKQVEKAEQKKQAEKQKQQKSNKEKEPAQLLEDISDCEQAVAKAIEKRKSISANDIKVFDSNFLIPGKDGLLYFPIGDVNVVDFASNGVFVSGHRYFIYTKDTDYATNEEFRGEGLIYEKVGNYKYTTITGATRSVPAYKATSHKISEINPKTYLKNKNLSCCQYQHHNSTEGDEFKEVGVEVKSHCSDADSVSKSPHYAPPLWCTNGNLSGRTCFTNNHPKGAGFSSSALCTGINYKE